VNGTNLTLTRAAGQPSRDELAELYQKVRAQSVALCAPLAPEDMVVQSMPDASPTKWHLSHTTWFFETFVLKAALPAYRSSDARYAYLYNSYYEGVGAQFPRAQRGLLSRPTVQEVLAYRKSVDAEIVRFVRHASDGQYPDYAFLIEVGVNHEEQHQELMLTDIKTVLCENPLEPAYAPEPVPVSGQTPPLAWLGFGGGLVEIGDRSEGFAFDNERPRHRVYLEPFELGARPVSWGEYLEFVGDGGYQRAELWLSDGWAAAKRERWELPAFTRPTRTVAGPAHGCRPKQNGRFLRNLYRKAAIFWRADAFIQRR
jgi:ergothioneine biosynthesis protein EgtB